MRFASLLAVLCLGFASPVGAAPVTYRLDTPGVQCKSSSARAESAAKAVGGVEAVAADASTRQLTVRFDDEKLTVRQLERALRSNGVRVSRSQRLD